MSIAIYNREALAASESCGCFCCLAVYNPVEIVSWVDPPDGTPYTGDYAENGRTALCARCGIDAVIRRLQGTRSPRGSSTRCTDGILNDHVAFVVWR